MGSITANTVVDAAGRIIYSSHMKRAGGIPGAEDIEAGIKTAMRSSLDKV
jgi:hypothetical protein